VDFTLGAFTAFGTAQVFDRMQASLCQVTSWCDSIRIVKDLGYWMKAEFVRDFQQQNYIPAVSNLCSLSADVLGLASFGLWVGGIDPFVAFSIGEAGILAFFARLGLENLSLSFLLV